MTRQYYYKANVCPAADPSDPACVCWHDEGEESLDSTVSGYLSPVFEDTERGERFTWRDKPVTTPAPAQPEGQEDEPVMWECKHEEETDGRWRECLKREFAERDGLPGWDVRAFYLHPSRSAGAISNSTESGGFKTAAPITSTQAVNAWNKLVEVTGSVFVEPEGNEVMRLVRNYAQFQYEAGLAAGAAAPAEGVATPRSMSMFASRKDYDAAMAAAPKEKP